VGGDDPDDKRAEKFDVRSFRFIEMTYQKRLQGRHDGDAGAYSAQRANNVVVVLKGFPRFEIRWHNRHRRMAGE
jgi:hypothetical protein